MSPVLRNILAVICGLVVGNVVNMAILSISAHVIPLPEGAALEPMEKLKESMHLFEPKHFLMPFLAHSLGTFVGAFFAALIAVKNRMRFALGIGCFFLIGGTVMVFILPSPLWFSLTDLILAYIPMAYLGGKLALRIKK